MSKRSNRTRGNRPLNMGAGLRARQMKPGGSRGTRGSSAPDPLFPDNPEVEEEALLFAETGRAIVTEGGNWMTTQ